VIVRVIYVGSVDTFETKCHPPIPRDPNGITTLQLPLKGMETKSWDIHITGAFRLIERRENTVEFPNVFR
jgi:hypothetical protein